MYKANLGNGQTCRLFKVLQNNACVNNCKYCAFRRDRDCKREVATPTEMAYAFDLAWKRRLVDGLFLSSGLVGSADATVEKMVDTVKILREKMMYKVYVHLKLRQSGKKVPSLTTQFVVGAGGENDREIIMKTDFLMRFYNFKRV